MFALDGARRSNQATAHVHARNQLLMQQQSNLQIQGSELVQIKIWTG
jgi:hypothetical protein